MKKSEALAILHLLADGVDPQTGEFLPDDAPYQAVRVVRALFIAIKALEKTEQSPPAASKVAVNVGAKWSDDEEDRLISAYKKGFSIREMAASHQRTRGAITSRLFKLGLLGVPATDSMADGTSKDEHPTGLKTSSEEIEDGPLSETRACVTCGEAILAARLRFAPEAVRCVPCQNELEAKNPTTGKWRVDEGIAGTREDHKRLRARDFVAIRERGRD